jgi:TonB family protein
MTAVSLLRDLAAFSVQIAIVIVVVAALLHVVRIPAGVRYLVLRLTLLACLLVPWTLRTVVVVREAPASVAALQILVPSAGAASPTSAPEAASSKGTGPSRPLPDLPWAALGLAALIAGVTARAIWLAIGFFRLGKLTRRAVPVESAEYARLQKQLRTAATISEVDRLAQPVTFGFHRPVVLLPGSLASAPQALRRAVVTHELFHVRRGDWLALLGEEAVRTALWFHPAIHWLTASIQLAREEMVDELTVRATGDRRAYMQALLAFADTGGLRAAPAFAHRRQLFHRILSVSKEKVMSAPRIVLSIAALAVAVSSASWYASSAFPIVRASRIELPAVGVPPIDDGWLIAEPQFVTVTAARQRGSTSSDRNEPNEVTPDNPIPRRTRGASPLYPQVTGAQPEVVVNTLVRIGRDGVVTNVFDKGCSVHIGARLLDRRQESDGACRRFFDVAATAIRQWRYERPVRGPLQFSVVLTFRPGTETTVAQSSEWATYVRETQESLRLLAQETGGIAIVNQREFEQQLRDLERELRNREDALRNLMERLRELERAQRLALERGPGNPDLAQLQEELARLNDQMARQEKALRGSAQVAEAVGQRTQAEEMLRAARAAQEAARAAEAERAVREAQVRALAERLLPQEARNRLPLVSPSGKTPIRVGDTFEERPRVLQRTNPEYSAEAMAARVEGVVVLEVLVDEEGRVADARVIKSIPLLDESALTAIRQWRFTATRLKGEPVPVIVQVEMQFTLK